MCSGVNASRFVSRGQADDWEDVAVGPAAALVASAAANPDGVKGKLRSGPESAAAAGGAGSEPEWEEDWEDDADDGAGQDALQAPPQEGANEQTKQEWWRTRSALYKRSHGFVLGAPRREPPAGLQSAACFILCNALYRASLIRSFTFRLQGEAWTRGGGMNSLMRLSKAVASLRLWRTMRQARRKRRQGRKQLGARALST